jgi:hypothetical protein
MASLTCICRLMYSCSGVRCGVSIDSMCARDLLQGLYTAAYCSHGVVPLVLTLETERPSRGDSSGPREACLNPASSRLLLMTATANCLCASEHRVSPDLPVYREHALDSDIEPASECNPFDQGLRDVPSDTPATSRQSAVPSVCVSA